MHANMVPIMTARSFILEVEARAAVIGVSMRQVCKRAGVAESTPNRIKNELTDPLMGTLNRLEQAIEELEREHAKNDSAA